MALLPMPKKKLVNGQMETQLPGTKDMTLKQASDLAQVKPITPLGAVNIGATDKAADMVGTPAQTQAAAREATDAALQMPVAQAKVEAQSMKGGGTFDQAMQNLNTQIMTLGSADARIPALVKEKVNNTLSGAGTQVQVTAQEKSALAKADPAMQDALLQNKAVYANKQPDGTTTYTYGPPGSGPKAGTALPGAATALMQPGADSNVSAMTAGDITGSLDKAADVGRSVAQQVPDEFKMEMVKDQLSPEEQAAMDQLGVGAQDTRKMLHDKMRNMEAQFTDIAQAKALLANTAASLQDKAEARRYLVAQGLSGRYQPADKINDVVKQIEDNDTVQVMGKAVTISDMLNDDFLQKMAAEALNDPTQMEAMLKDPSMTGFAKYIQENAKAWEAIVKPIMESVKDGVAVADKFKAQSSFGNDAKIPAPLMDKLMPGWNEIMKTGQLQSPPILQAMNKITDPVQADAILRLLTASQTDEKLFEELKNMDLQQLIKSGLLDASKKSWEILTDVRGRNAAIKSAVTTSKDSVEATAKIAPKEATEWRRDMTSLVNSLKDAGIDIDNLDAVKDPDVQPYLDAVKALLEKMDPDGGLSDEYLAKLVSPPGSFWEGSTAKETMDPLHITALLQQAQVSATAAISRLKSKRVEKEAEQAQRTAKVLKDATTISEATKAAAAKAAAAKSAAAQLARPKAPIRQPGRITQKF